MEARDTVERVERVEHVEDVDHVDAVETVELPDGRRLIVRPAVLDDRDDLVALYRRLSGDDLWLRFFTAAAPSPTFLERWLQIDEHGGLLLIALLEEPSGRTTLIGEAGYSPLDDGDGELGITVDPDWRGWLGPWLLAVLLREAATRGIPNIQAVVQLANRPMLRTLRRHQSAVLEQDAPDEIRLIVPTSGPTATWPAEREHPRIVVEAIAGRWAGEDAAKAAGFDVRTCRGPSSDHPCPMLEHGSCPLVEGADAVVVALPPAGAMTSQIIAAHRSHPDRQVIVPLFGAAGADPDETADEVVAGIRRALGLE